MPAVFGAATCSPSLFCGDLPPIPLNSDGFNSYANCTQPIDFDSIRRSVATGAVRERGSGNIILASRDPDNPDCVVEIVGSVELGAKNEQSESIRDARGYLGYIVNGEFVRNEKVALNQVFEPVGVDSSKNRMVRGSVETNIPVVGEHITAAGQSAPLNEVAGEAVQDAGVGGKLGGSHCGEVSSENRELIDRFVCLSAGLSPTKMSEKSGVGRACRLL